MSVILSFANEAWAILGDPWLITALVRLCLAAVLGGVVGFERGRRRRAAGLRTYILVCIGAALVMITNQYIIAESGTGDPTRLGAQVISGIGFLGVGTIIVDRKQQVRGLTTAAGLWACACMGLAIGTGYYVGAIIAAIFIFFTITILNRFESFIINKSEHMEVCVEFIEDSDLVVFLQALSERRIRLENMENVNPDESTLNGGKGYTVILSLRLPKKSDHATFLQSVEHIPGLVSIEEMR
jgi:putative Mg2+ transporter-C (MgtC) family protein